MRSASNLALALSRGALAALFSVACGGHTTSESAGADPGSAGAINGAGGTTDDRAGSSGMSASGAPGSGGDTSAGASGANAAAGASGASGGSASGGSASGGSTSGGSTSGGSTSGGSASGGSASGGSASGGSASGGSASGGSTSGGAGGSAPGPCNPIVIADPILEAEIRAEIARPTGEIRAVEAQQLHFVFAAHAGLTSLSGLECFPNVGYLDLSSSNDQPNHLSDFGPLAALKKLGQLYLTGNEVADLTPLGELDGLTNLTIQYAIHGADLAPLGKLRHLQSLDMQYDVVGDLSSLGNIPSLRSVYLYGGTLLVPGSLSALTQISGLDLGAALPSPDLTPLAELTQLTALGLSANHLTDIHALGGLTNLVNLDVTFNELTDISAVAPMTKLDTLAFASNHVSDISVVRDLTQLTYLDMSTNLIASLSPVVQNSGINQGDFVWADENPLDCTQEAMNIQALQAHSVLIFTDCP